MRDNRGGHPGLPDSGGEASGEKEQQEQANPPARFACPCCDYYTLPEPPPGTYRICPVCYWEDGGVQHAWRDYRGGANGVSLQDARRNFAAWGYAKERSKQSVRPPRPEEFPPG